MATEVAALQRIRPHAVVTTNYDQFLELVFPEYHPIIGQQIIQGASLCIGEIFKIHGCVSDPNSLVFTRTDYNEFTKKKKYLRVGPKSSSTQTKLSEHETNRGEVEKSERVSGEIFEILGQPAAAIKPSESAFDNPTSRQKLEPFCPIGAFDDFDLQMRQDFG
jgi:hypothetical protein